MGRACILLVEDEQFIRELIAEVLLEADLDVLEAADGEAAMELLKQRGRVDLLMTDVHMPGRINGVDLARRARLRYPELPVVFATGRPETLKAFGELGPRDICMSKPFTPMEVLRVVERLLAAQVQASEW